MDEQRERRFFSFSYYVRKRRGRDLRPHQLRDQTAFAELVAFFTERGYSYAGPLLNYPSDEFLEIDTSFLTASDLLVLPTRPPIHDERHGDRRQIEPSNTSLEHEVFGALRQYFAMCARSHVKLSEEMADMLESPFEDRADITFRQHGGPWYKALKTHEGFPGAKLKNKPEITAAYLVRLPNLWEGGPALLTAFGMSGVETQVWIWLLRRRYPELLESPRFVMAELKAAPIPERPITLDFADDWDVNILINHEI